METITFEAHPITPTTPKNMLATIFKNILILFAFIFLCTFSFVKHIMHVYIRERKEIPNYVKVLTLHFCYAETYVCHFMIDGNSDEMVIYAFLLGFVSHSRKKE